jgi:hypothetical protein
MSLTMNVNAKVMKGLEEMFQRNTTETIKILAGKYGFDLAEALEELNVAEEVKIVKGKSKEGKEVKEVKEKVVKEKKGKTEKKEVPKMVLPFCGRVVEEWCEGVKLNHGLYSQCVNEKSASGEKYCKTCKKQAAGNESGKPTLGDISERMSVSSEAYRAAKGKKCVVYAVVLKKLKIEKAEAVAEALKFGLEIPEEEFEMPKSQRGRPKKLSESESVKSGSDDGEKKRRGRPKKNKTVAATTSDDTDDLIASLVAEANLLKSSSASEAEASEAEASEAEASEAEDEAEEEASEGEAEREAEEEAIEGEESVGSVEWEPSLLEKIVAKVSADATFNKLNGMVVAKKERKAHLKAIGEHIKSILTEEEMALYTGAPEEDCEEDSESEAEGEAEEDEASRKAREAAEKKAQAELEKKAQKEQADLEKKQKKEQADLEKKAKAEADKKLKAEADAEKKAQAKQKKEQADLEKKAKAEADKKAKAEADKKEKKPAEKKPAEKKPKKAAEKKATKAAEVTPAVKEGVDEELQEEAPSSSASEAEAEAEGEAEAEPAAAVNAKVFEFKGKKYLKTEEGILYDKETEECVGVWNEETKSIDDFADDEE